LCGNVIELVVTTIRLMPVRVRMVTDIRVMIVMVVIMMSEGGTTVERTVSRIH
jgi:hypothetical protein